MVEKMTGKITGKNIEEKEEKLKRLIESYGSASIAFSAGVDSTYLLKIANTVLGEKAIAVTARSSTFPERELNEAKAFCKENKIRHIIIESDELEIDGFSKNPPNRCYLCKKGLFSKILEVKVDLRVKEIIEGSNVSDDDDYRPGQQAIRELGIKSPLKEIGFTKDEIRERSKILGLPTFDKPAFACLSSRFPFGNEITKEKLAMIDKAEDFLLNLGFKNIRVRIHDDIARIETGKENFPLAVDNADEISKTLKQLGFKFVSLDLAGYKMGSMNFAS